MANMNWAKNTRARLWRESERAAWRPAPTVRPATAKQKDYVQILLGRHGKEPLTAEELSRLTMAGASRIIAEFTGS